MAFNYKADQKEMEEITQRLLLKLTKSVCLSKSEERLLIQVLM